ncbi:MAG: hypothetical protein ACF8Q5_02280 [Phycisphaerales bacterium JB040]
MSRNPTRFIVGAAVWAGCAAPVLLAQPSFEYAHDDGSGYTESSLAQYDARVTWGNAFRARDPWTTIARARVSFASDVGAGKAVRIGVWDLDTSDPTTGVLVSLTDLVVPAPTGPEDFHTFELRPAEVSGWFFVGVIADLAIGERAMRQDFSTLGTRSWRFDNPVGEDNFDLGSAGYGGRLGDFGLGTWMVRAVAVPAPATVGVLGLGCLSARRRRLSARAAPG